MLGAGTMEFPPIIQALGQIDARPDIALMITDVVMPGMNGRVLAGEVKARRPGLPVLFTTGYTRNAIVHNGVLDTGVNFLAKRKAEQQNAIEQLGPGLRAMMPFLQPIVAPGLTAKTATSEK